MSDQTFPQALQLVLAHEGGWSNNPKDPGGATMRGVTQEVYDRYRDNKGLPHQTVRNIDGSELNEMYRNQYWAECSCDRLPAGLDYAVFDYAVNSGPERAIKDLQREVGAGVDGQLGEQSVSLVCGVNDVDDLIARYCTRRLAFLKSLRTWKDFGKGWERRIEGDSYGSQSGDDGVIDLAVKIHDAMNAGGHELTTAALAAIKPPTAIGDKTGEVAGKGSPADVAVTKTPQGKGIIATAVGGIGTAAATLGQLANQSQPVVDNVQRLSNAVVVVHTSAHKLFGVVDASTLAFLGVGFTATSVAGCLFFGWHYFKSQREKTI